jgi:hypothetical protein
MPRIVGVTAHAGLQAATRTRIEAAQSAALRHFPWLEQRVESLGALTLTYWGVEVAGVRAESAGQVTLVVGDLNGDDGRGIELTAARDGAWLRLRHDWLGGVPVYRLHASGEMLVSTLEPVAAAASSEKRLSKEGLACLLVSGHFESGWTLSEDVDTLPPDSEVEWRGAWSTPQPRGTVAPSSERLESGWSELIDELYELTLSVCRRALSEPGLHTIPLSSGMDSRLVAAVAQEEDVETELVTYGKPDELEVLYAGQVARSLSRPWRVLDLGTRYLSDFTRIWADWFGGAMHFHGMYQMSFLKGLGQSPAPLVHGYMGDPLAGNHIDGLERGEGLSDGSAPLSPSWGLWTRAEIEALVREPLADAFENVLAARRALAESLPGPRYKRLMLLDAWLRQHRLISYQPTMYDYWRGVVTPFLSADYARFWLSLPRAALDDRRLQKAMLVERFPELATIAGTFSTYPLTPSESYVWKRSLATRLPVRLRRGPLREFHTPHRVLDTLALQSGGRAALWPLDASRRELGEIVDLSVVEATISAAFAGDLRAYLKLSALQALALWLQR